MNVADASVGGNSWLINTLPTVGKNLDANTLGDLSVVAPEGGLTSEYSVQVITYGADGQLDGNYVYLDAESNGLLYGVESGWYTTASVEEWAPEACGETPVVAGQMLNILSDCGAVMTIPSALPSASAE